MLSILPTLPIELPDGKLLRYFKNAMPRVWQSAYASSGITLKSTSQAVEYFKRLERFERRCGRNKRGVLDGSDPDNTNSPPQLNVQLSEATAPLVARVSTGCSLSYINSRFVDGNKKMEFAAAPPGETVELVEGLGRVEGYARATFRLLDLQCGTRTAHTFLVIPDTADDIGFGCDLLSALGLTISYSKGVIEWNGDSVALHEPTNL